MELEEAIKVLELLKEVDKKQLANGDIFLYVEETKMEIKAIETLIKYIKEESIPRAVVEEKISWKPISEYNRKNYDWVLVKYFDGDYECVPEVAERRSDGKWYTSEKEIPFEVKYFFDIQEILNKGE